MSSLIDPMTRDNLDTNIIAHGRNLIIMISFMLCYVSCEGFRGRQHLLVAAEIKKEPNKNPSKDP